MEKTIQHRSNDELWLVLDNLSLQRLHNDLLWLF